MIAKAKDRGTKQHWPDQYQPDLLRPINRADMRQALQQSMTFTGFDLWRAYDFSWLNQNGCPEVAAIKLKIPCESPRMIESKSLKLYLNSFAQTHMDRSKLQQSLEIDLEKVVLAPVWVQLISLAELQADSLAKPEGACLDQQPDIVISHYQPAPKLLCQIEGERVEQLWLYSHLLRTLCPITHQPDWGSLCIRYSGQPICQQGLLQYIVSKRQEACFHESAVEQIFSDIMQYCTPEDLVVYACFQRRGGIDINPYRSQNTKNIELARMARQ